MITIISIFGGQVMKGDRILSDKNGGEKIQGRVFEVIKDTLTFCTELEYWRDHVKVSLTQEEMEIARHDRKEDCSDGLQRNKTSNS